MNDAGWLLPGMVKAPLVEKAFHTMPLSLSVMNVMDGLRGTQDMVVVGESAVNEASTPIDYVGSGSQVITLNIKWRVDLGTFASGTTSVEPRESRHNCEPLQRRIRP